MLVDNVKKHSEHLLLWTTPETTPKFDIRFTPNVYTEEEMYDDTSLNHSYYIVRETLSVHTNSEQFLIISVLCMTHLVRYVYGQYMEVCVLLMRKG